MAQVAAGHQEGHPEGQRHPERSIGENLCHDGVRTGCSIIPVLGAEIRTDHDALL
jgi:hypothetical protein